MVANENESINIPVLNLLSVFLFLHTIPISSAFVSPTRSLFLIHESKIFRSCTRGRTIPARNVGVGVDRYGRGAEIWPPTNDEEYSLSDSFPKGISPPLPPPPTQDTKLKWYTPPDVWVAGTLTVMLAMTGLVRPMDVSICFFMSTYFYILSRTMTKSTLQKKLISSFPLYPLSYRFTQKKSTSSKRYRRWFLVGDILGMALPLVHLSVWFVLLLISRGSRNQMTVKLVARTLFFSLIQRTSQWLTDHEKAQVPLPIHILIPISYTTIRLTILWEWVLSAFAAPAAFHFSEHMLGIGNLLYGMLHLFGFLIPIATMKYLRVHFFCLEAKEVTVREGYENGLLL